MKEKLKQHHNGDHTGRFSKPEIEEKLPFPVESKSETRRKILKQQLYLLIFTQLFLSCQCDKLYFNEGERYWATSYKKGDITIFQSNLDSLKKDTIFILDNVHTLPTGKCNPSVRSVDPESYRIDYKYSHNGKMSDSDYLVQHIKDNQSSLPVIRVYDVEYNGSAFVDTTLILKNFKSQYCHIITNFQSFENLPDFKIKNFIWSKDLGLVQITLENGEIYQLIKKYNSKK